MPIVPRRLVAQLILEDRASGVIRRVDSNFAKLRSRIAIIGELTDAFRAAGYAMTFTGGLAAGAILKMGDSFAKLDHEARKASAVFGKLSQKDVTDLINKSRKLSLTTVASAKDIAKAYFQLASKGFDKRQSDKMIQTILNLSVALDTDLSDAAEHVTSIMRTFGIEAGKASKILDIYVQADKMSASNFTNLQEAMKFAGAAAAIYGTQIEDVVALLSMLFDAGIKGGMAGRVLAMAFRNLAKPTAEAQKVLAKYGITQENVYDLLRKPSELIKKLLPMLKNEADFTRVFTSRAQRFVLVLRQQERALAANKDRFGELTGAFKVAQKEGVGVQRVIAFLGSLWSKMRMTINAAAAAFQVLFKEMQPKFEKTMEKMRQFFLYFASDKAKDVRKVVAAILFFLAKFGLLAGGFLVITGSIISFIRAITSVPILIYKAVRAMTALEAATTAAGAGVAAAGGAATAGAAVGGVAAGARRGLFARAGGVVGRFMSGFGEPGWQASRYWHPRTGAPTQLLMKELAQHPQLGKARLNERDLAYLISPLIERGATFGFPYKRTEKWVKGQVLGDMGELGLIQARRRQAEAIRKAGKPFGLGTRAYAKSDLVRTLLSFRMAPWKGEPFATTFSLKQSLPTLAKGFSALGDSVKAAGMALRFVFTPAGMATVAMLTIAYLSVKRTYEMFKKWQAAKREAAVKEMQWQQTKKELASTFGASGMTLDEYAKKTRGKSFADLSDAEQRAVRATYTAETRRQRAQRKAAGTSLRRLMQPMGYGQTETGGSGQLNDYLTSLAAQRQQFAVPGGFPTQTYMNSNGMNIFNMSIAVDNVDAAKRAVNMQFDRRLAHSFR